MQTAKAWVMNSDCTEVDRLIVPEHQPKPTQDVPSTGHDQAAAQTLWWASEDRDTWRTKFADGRWREVCLTPGAVQHPAPVLLDEDWRPWEQLCDGSEAPYYKWFAGATTNACFNGVDKHLLEGNGHTVAFTFIPEDSEAASEGRLSITRRQLAGAVAECAQELNKYGLKAKVANRPLHSVMCAICRRGS